MIKFRDQTLKRLGLQLHVQINQDVISSGVEQFSHGNSVHTDVMKTQALRQALDQFQFDAAIGGVRRDVVQSCSKERIFSHRTFDHR